MADEEDLSEEEEIPDEEKIAIAKYFVTSSPPGHAGTVVTAVKKLGMDALMTDAAVSGMMQQYHTTKHSVVPFGDGQIVIGTDAEVDATHYVDTVTKKVVEFDPLTGKASVGRDASPEELNGGAADMEGHRAAIEAALAKYIAVAYGKDEAGKPCAAIGVFGAPGQVKILIGAERRKLTSCWSGRMSSEWVVAVDGGKATVTGSVKIMGHYFEEGNVQMHNSKEIAATEVAFGDAAALGDAVAAHVKKETNALHMASEELFTNMQGKVFKEIRRALPLTKTKFNWTSSAVHKVAQTVGNK